MLVSYTPNKISQQFDKDNSLSLQHSSNFKFKQTLDIEKWSNGKKLVYDQMIQYALWYKHVHVSKQKIAERTGFSIGYVKQLLRELRIECNLFVKFMPHRENSFELNPLFFKPEIRPYLVKFLPSLKYVSDANLPLLVLSSPSYASKNKSRALLSSPNSSSSCPLPSSKDFTQLDLTSFFQKMRALDQKRDQVVDKPRDFGYDTHRKAKSMQEDQILDYVADKLKLKFTQKEIEILSPFDPDILKYAVDHIVSRLDIVLNKVGLLITICRRCEKETTPHGTFIHDEHIKKQVHSPYRKNSFSVPTKYKPSTFKPQEPAQSSKDTPKRENRVFPKQIITTGESMKRNPHQFVYKPIVHTLVSVQAKLDEADKMLKNKELLAQIDERTGVPGRGEEMTHRDIALWTKKYHELLDQELQNSFNQNTEPQTVN